MQANQPCSVMNCKAQAQILCNESYCSQNILCYGHSKEHQHLSLMFFSKIKKLVDSEFQAIAPMSKKVIDQMMILRKRLIDLVEDRFNLILKQVQKKIFNNEYIEDLTNFRQGKYQKVTNIMPMVKALTGKSDQKIMQKISQSLQNIANIPDKFQKKFDLLFNNISKSIVSSSNQFHYDPSTHQGIVHWLGTEHSASNNYQNIHKLGKVKIQADQGYYNITDRSTNGTSDLSLMFKGQDHIDTVASICALNQAFFIFEFPEHEIQLQAVEIFNYYGDNETYLPDGISIFAQLQGDWKLLDCSCEGIQKGKLWKVGQQGIISNKFKFLNQGNYQLLISRIQFYGSIKPL